MSQRTVSRSPYYRHLREKSLLQCALLLIPIVGNIGTCPKDEEKKVSDKKKTQKKEPEKKQETSHPRSYRENPFLGTPYANNPYYADNPYDLDVSADFTNRFHREGNYHSGNCTLTCINTSCTCNDDRDRKRDLYIVQGILDLTKD
jgi:hypothetical protein